MVGVLYQKDIHKYYPFSMIIFISFFILLIFYYYPSYPQHKINKSYLDTKLPIQTRVNILLSQMTLEEKIGQLIALNPNTQNIFHLIKDGHVGSLVGVYLSSDKIDGLQHIAVHESRLGIPLFFGSDVLHGYFTIFPIPIAQACSWDTSLIRKCASAVALEASSNGIRWTMAPMIDITRDPRWGRIAEGFGEDPFLVSSIAVSIVKGFQGYRLDSTSKLVSCIKHFVGYGAAEGGRDYNTTDIPIRTLKEIYLPPFDSAIRAGAYTIMTAFNDLNGVPCAANSFILKTILRGEWGFNGIVRGDANAVEELVNHGIACDECQAALKAFSAGVDMDIGYAYSACLVNLVKTRKISIQDIDSAVSRILYLKFLIGLFDHPYINHFYNPSDSMSLKYRKLARKLSEESIVLLKNDKNLLPLNKNIRSIAVIGPLANDKIDMLGCWKAMGNPQSTVTLLSAIKSKVSRYTTVYYAKGCDINDTSTHGFTDAVEIAKKSDVIILAVGESADMTGEASSRASLDLPGVQDDLIKLIASLHKPTIEVIMSGRPLSISYSVQHLQAILQAWFLGNEAGNAIADVIFGYYNPSGKLPLTWPVSVGQIPIYYNHMNTGKPPSEDNRFTSKYIDMTWKPLFPFGYGLSYTKFAYSDLRIYNSNAFSYHNPLLISINVKNIGKRSGYDIIQLYVHKTCASVTRPVQELKGFKRVFLNPGESKTIYFKLFPVDVSYYNTRMQRVLEPGTLKIMVGDNSIDYISTYVDINHTYIFK